MSNLDVDGVRPTVPFDERFASASTKILASPSDAELARRLRSWIHADQPCLFGRMAVGKSDLLSICVLTEKDLIQPDSVIRQKISDHRIDWKRRAFRGQRSGFLIMAACRQLADAEPNSALLRFAARLAELYLLEEVVPDRVYHDRLQLELSDAEVREWVAGVNFFGAQADGRWWHDHRIPGGVAFSMNSIGHMIRSGTEQNRERDLAAVTSASQGKIPVSGLDTALRYAMQTIDEAHATVSGPATCLRSLSENADLSPEDCPLDPIPERLIGKDWTTYDGWYDTDVTLPSIYFRPDVERPAEAKLLQLDFSYLFDESNIDYHRTGPGVKTR